MDRVWELMDRRAANKATPRAAAVGRARERKQTLAECVKNLMKKLNISFTEAVILLDIPESNWDMYRKIVDDEYSRKNK